MEVLDNAAVGIGANLLVRPRTGATGGRFGPPVFLEEHWRVKPLAGCPVCFKLGAKHEKPRNQR